LKLHNYQDSQLLIGLSVARHRQTGLPRSLLFLVRGTACLPVVFKFPLRNFVHEGDSSASPMGSHDGGGSSPHRAEVRALACFQTSIELLVLSMSFFQGPPPGMEAGQASFFQPSRCLPDRECTRPRSSRDGRTSWVRRAKTSPMQVGVVSSHHTPPDPSMDRAFAKRVKNPSGMSISLGRKNGCGRASGETTL